MINKLFTILILPLFLASCTMIPKLEQPQQPYSAVWPAGEAYTHNNIKGNPAEVAWKDYFQSASMNKLIDRVLENNRDLRIAVLNIERARAAYRISKSDIYPDVNGNLSGTRQGIPEDMSTTGKSMTVSTFNANVATSYELDFFGKVQSMNQKALATYLATAEAHNNARIVIISEAANAYLAYLADRKLLDVAEKTLKSQRGTYNLILKKYELGSGTQLDVSRAETQVKTAQSAVIQYTRMLAQAKNAIVLLAGSSVEDILDDSDTIDSVKFLENLPSGLPSEVLAARPDIKQAEHMMKAANADIGAARAALYPSISLTGSFGFASDKLSSLFSEGASYAWNFTPAVSIPIFNRGRIKANLEVAEVNEKIAAAQYEKALQTAFREVADQLAARGTYKKQLETQKALTTSTKKTYELANLRYDNGISDYLTVLDAQRGLFAAEQATVTVRQQYLGNLVSLYKVLGGGQL